VGSPWTARVLAASCLAVSLAATAVAQSIAVDRQRGEQMLDQIREDLVEHYYDPTFHGIDLDDLIERARQRINTAQSIGEIFGLLAGVCLDLHDSHSLFVPPERVQDVRYGWGWRYVGDQALIDWVDDDSDARGKGLRVGDTVLEVSGYALTRANERTVLYLLSSLRPQPQLHITTERDGTRRTLTVDARIRKRRPRLDIADQWDRRVADMQAAKAMARRPKPNQAWLAEGVLYWRLPDFFDPPTAAIRSQADKLWRSRRVILDLRDNPGGNDTVLLEVAGLFAPKGTPVLSVHTREGRANLAATAAREPYPGAVIVLVDSRSASMAEVLARFLQQRGARVIGDVTSGAVTGGRMFKHAAGEADIRVFYAVIVTISDMLMVDGSRLEGVGVQPDIASLPTPDDLERGADPVLAKAAALLGVTIDPPRAGRLSRP
jgi:C-terminal processing protease CtpA/Prc